MAPPDLPRAVEILLVAGLLSGMLASVVGFARLFAGAGPDALTALAAGAASFGSIALLIGIRASWDGTEGQPEAAYTAGAIALGIVALGVAGATIARPRAFRGPRGGVLLLR